MKLTKETLAQRQEWEKIGVRIPAYDYPEMVEYTRRHPVWLHIGPGNIFRAHIAMLQQKLLDMGVCKGGIIAAAPNNREIIDKIYAPHDNLSVLVRMHGNGQMDKEVIASIAESLAMVPTDEDWQRLLAIAADKDLAIISFTITEKGYKTKDDNGMWLEAVQKDLAEGPQKVNSFAGKLTALLLHRFNAGGVPVTLLSLDNCAHNGDVLREMVLQVAGAWQKQNYVSDAFMEYVSQKISYPCSMIDKITPRPSGYVRDLLLKDNLEDMDFVKSSRGGWYAPFVNAEKTEYLVIEDNFANGRPPLEKAGVIFTDRETVDKVEQMKVGTCLNPLHTALAIFGCLLGYESIAAEMKDEDLRALVERIGYQEGLPVVENPKVLEPKAFLTECIEQRFPNPYIPDTPQRIACDTSQKLPVRFGNTVRAYRDSAQLDIRNLQGISLVYAGWLRYLLGIDDKGEKFAPNADPLLAAMQEKLRGIKLGHLEHVHERLNEILEQEELWGCDLHKAGLAKMVEDDFICMLSGAGAVRRTLHKLSA